MTATIDKRFLLGKVILDEGGKESISFNGVSFGDVIRAERVFGCEDYLIQSVTRGPYVQGETVFAKYDLTIRKLGESENA